MQRESDAGGATIGQVQAARRAHGLGRRGTQVGRIDVVASMAVGTDQNPCFPTSGQDRFLSATAAAGNPRARQGSSREASGAADRACAPLREVLRRSCATWRKSQHQLLRHRRPAPFYYPLMKECGRYLNPICAGGLANWMPRPQHLSAGPVGQQ